MSETARGGETIIHRIGMSYYKETWFGYYHTEDNTVVDAPELTISHSTTGGNKYIVIHGKTVEVHDIIERSGSGSSSHIQIKASATFKANSLVSAGYIEIYGPYHNTPATQGINRDIKHILNGYYLALSTASWAFSSRLKFKTFLTYYIGQPGPAHFITMMISIFIHQGSLALVGLLQKWQLTQQLIQQLSSSLVALWAALPLR